MNLLLPRDVRARLKAELRRAGDREIGGFLMAEQLAPGAFRIIDITVDHTTGTVMHFRRRIEQHQEQLRRFFAETGHDFGRYNYLGEWHSHPRFSVNPSADDLGAMRDLVGQAGIDFAVLMIVRLDWHYWLRRSARSFSSDGSISLVRVS
jgi:proteasome lid subunit RPN8/RPN11